MGATSAQGWYLFAFIVGFTILPAGLFALGWVATAAGAALLVVAFAGFRSIKEPATKGPESAERGRVPSSVGARAANSSF